MNEQIKDAFHWIDLSLDDFKKFLDADYLEGHGPNFSIGMMALAITEPIAKLYWPFTRKKNKENRIQEIRVRRRGSYKAHTFDDIDAKLAIHRFFRSYFENERYSQLSDFIWDAFRNSHVHLFQSKKIINVPIDGIDNSFLTGVFFGSEPKTNKKKEQYQNINDRIHLKFEIRYNNNIPRPVFIFAPYIYYFDLKEAVKRFKNDLINESNQSLTRRFLKAHKLFVEAKRLDFMSNKISKNTRKILTKDIKKILK